MKKQRNTFQRKEQDTIPETDLNATEMSDLPGGETLFTPVWIRLTIPMTV